MFAFDEGERVKDYIVKSNKPPLCRVTNSVWYWSIQLIKKVILSGRAFSFLFTQLISFWYQLSPYIYSRDLDTDFQMLMMDPETQIINQGSKAHKLKISIFTSNLTFSFVIEYIYHFIFIKNQRFWFWHRYQRRREFKRAFEMCELIIPLSPIKIEYSRDISVTFDIQFPASRRPRTRQEFSIIHTANLIRVARVSRGYHVIKIHRVRGWFVRKEKVTPKIPKTRKGNFYFMTILETFFRHKTNKVKNDLLIRIPEAKRAKICDLQKFVKFPSFLSHKLRDWSSQVKPKPWAHVTLSFKI